MMGGAGLRDAYSSRSCGVQEADSVALQALLCGVSCRGYRIPFGEGRGEKGDCVQDERPRCDRLGAGSARSAAEVPGSILQTYADTEKDGAKTKVRAATLWALD